jgi:hypothetical protein
MPPRAAHRSLVLLASLAMPGMAGAQTGLGAQAVLTGTRLTNAVGGRTLTEGYVSQPAVMGHAALADGHLRLVGTLNFEGLTLRRGELLGGVYGEGFVDRRHPHTLVHEAVAAVQGNVPGAHGRVAASLAAGKGFVPFGTDDPMTRPFERFPVNHHLAQILERAVAVGALRAPRALVEVATFDGDEPTGPYAPPRLRRFGDSWAARLSALPLASAPAGGWSATGLELQASTAFVRAPETPDHGGLDQRKWSLAARWASGAPLGGSPASAGDGTYVMAEWASTDWLRDGRRVSLAGYRDASVLAEGGVRRGRLELVARVERTDRPEEERLADPFRTVRPAPDVSTLGTTRWRILTAGVSRPFGPWGPATLRLAPFVEISSLTPRALVPGAVFDPVAFYGGRHLVALTAGVRVGAGMLHARMGRYGVAAPAHAAMPGMMDMP